LFGGRRTFYLQIERNKVDFLKGGGKGFDVGACQLVANEVGPSSQKDVLVRVFSGQLHCRAIKRCPCRKLSWRHWKKYPIRNRNVLKVFWVLREFQIAHR